MLHVIRDLLRYNREFAIGVAFLGVIVVYSLLSLVSPIDPTVQFMEFPDLPPSGAIGLRHREFTRHAMFSGMSPLKIMFEEHLPYVMPVVFATAMANMLWAIGVEVTLAVLGFTNINIATVGTTIYWANNHSAMVVGIWWWIVIPVVLVVIMFIGLYLLAVSLNEYIDPRSRLRRMGG